MRSYRIYFRDPEGPILGRSDAVAEHDGEAFAIAHVLWIICSDVVSGYEVWQGSRMLRDENVEGLLPATAAGLSGAAQEQTISLEETLRSSHWAIAKSRRLLKELDGRMSTRR